MEDGSRWESSPPPMGGPFQNTVCGCEGLGRRVSGPHLQPSLGGGRGRGGGWSAAEVESELEAVCDSGFEFRLLSSGMHVCVSPCHPTVVPPPLSGETIGGAGGDLVSSPAPR